MVRSHTKALAIGVALVVSFWCCALLAETAPAATRYAFVSQFPQEPGYTPSHFESVRAQAIAVSDKNGHIYVADSGRGAIFDFESAEDKTPAKWTGSNTPAGSFGGGRVSVAVDNTSGDVYVADRTHAVVVKFDEAGNLIGSFGDTSPSPDGRLRGLETPAASFVPPTGFESSFGIAVDQATHELYVVDAGHKVIDVFDEEGGYLRQITAQPAGIYSGSGNQMSGIAVSAQTGNVFVSDLASALVFKFDSLGNYVSTWNGKDLPNGADSAIPSEDVEPTQGFRSGQLPLAVVDEKQRVLLPNGRFSSAIDTFDEAGNFVPPQLDPESRIVSTAAIAVDQSSEYLYVASAFNGVSVYEPRRVPDVTIGPVGEVKPQSAIFSGQFSPDGGDVVDCHFEYLADGRFRGNPSENRWAGAEQLPCQTTPPSSPPYSATTEVSAEATGLSPGRLYRLRLVASSATGANADVGQSFSAPGGYEYSGAIGASGSGDGQLDEPHDVAVDNATGAVYIADTGNHRVVKFSAAGAFVAAWGWGVANGASENQVCTSGCQAGTPGGAPGQLTEPVYIEVDNSSGPSAHSVYVADGDDRTVLKFTPGGSLVAGWGEGGSISFAKEGPLGGITVSSSGSLLVLSKNSPYPWTEIGQDGGLRSKTAPFQGPPSDGGIDVDESETWYEARAEQGVIAKHRDGGAQYLLYPTGYGAFLRLPTTGIVVDRPTSEVYVSQKDHIDHFRPQSGCVIKGQSVCEPVDTFGFGNLVEARGLAFDQSGKRVLAADTGADRVVVFSLVAKPTVTTGSAIPNGTSALLSGSAAPAPADSVSSCRFQYGTTVEYELGEVPCSPGAPFSTSTDVTAIVTELNPYQTYHYRLVAEGPSELPVYGQDQTLTPEGEPPTAQGGEAVEVGRTGATLTGLVNPNLGPTLYRFEYGTAPEYGSQTPVGGPIGEDNVDHPVSTEVTGLTPDTTYHFRVVAVNFAGIDVGPDRTFNTPDVPSILHAGVSATGTSTATASVTATPGFSQTSLSLDYGPTTAYGESVVEPLGSDNRAHEVELKLTGLAAGTTYHARVVATNAFGSASSADLTFTTPAATPPAGPQKCHRGFVRRGGKCKKRKRHRHHHGHKHGHGGNGR